MATGKSGYFDIAGSNYTTMRVWWSETYDIASNTSVVSAQLQVKTTPPGYSGYHSFLNGTLKINGATVATFNSFQGTHKVDIVNFDTFYNVTNSSGVAETYSTTVAHNADGSKSVAIEVDVNGYRDEYSFVNWYCGGSSTVVLTTIPRKSTLYAGNGTLGAAQTLTVSKQADIFTHTITYACGSDSGQICDKASATSISWTPPISLASQNTTGTSVSIKLTITTFNGSTDVGSNSVVISCAIPASVAPSCSLTVSDYTGLATTYGAMIKGYSRLAVAVDAVAAYGAGITAYQVTADGATYSGSSVVTGVLNSSGTLTVTAKVTDQRGRTASTSKNVSVLDYSAPAVTLLKVKRCNADGTDNDQGEYCQVTFSGKVTALGNKNSATYKLEYLKSGDSAYTAVTFSELANNYAVTEAKHIFVADSGSSYEVRITITDNFTSDFSAVPLSTGATIMHWKANGKGMGIGKVSEVDNALDMGWNIQMNGHAVTGLPTPVNASDAVNLGYLAGESTKVGNMLFRKINNVVYVSVPNGYAVASQVSIPQGYRPNATLVLPCVYTTTSYTDGLGRLKINPDGTAQITNANGNIVTDGWINICTCYHLMQN